MPLTPTPYPFVTAANGDNQPAAAIGETVIGIVDNGGVVDRLYGYFGSLPVRNTGLEQQFSQLIVMLRAILLAHTATNQLLGLALNANNYPGAASTRLADDLQMQDLIQRARVGAPVDPNTLQ